MIKLDHAQVLASLPDRKEDSHKGDYGRILLLCGSVGCTGAPELAAMGALRSGAGLVYMAVPQSIYPIEAVKLTEPLVLPLPDCNGAFAPAALNQVLELLPKMDAVLIGPGIGKGEGASVLLQGVLEYFPGPVVIDADGINLLKGHMDLVRGRKWPVILTPHEGEYARIGGIVDGDRFDGTKAFAADNGIILVRKGHRTVITDGITGYLNETGNPGMAVGGSGDLLAGMITSLIGQGLDPLLAAACGAWLHGAAGDLCSEEMGQYAMLPSDMLRFLPRLMK